MLDQFSREFTLFYEKLRKSRNFKQEEFTQDIVSVRQYRRYLKGESVIPQYVANQLAERLGFNPDYIMKEFNSDRVQEREMVVEFYNAAANKDLQNLKRLRRKIKRKEIIDPQNKLLYDYAIECDRWLRNKITAEDMVENVKSLINYPKVLNNNVFSSNEMLIFSSFFTLKAFNEKDKVAEKIQEYILSVNLYTTENTVQIILASFQLAKYYGMVGSYKKVLKLTKKIIDYSKTKKSYYLLDYFYYYSALANYRIDKIEEFKKDLSKCFCILAADDNEAKMTKFKNYVEKDFDINFKAFVLDYLNEA
ncbi:MAG: helix-turn-helix domain-containing protein [Candidatus Izemoplasmataceae bacterium]